MDDLDPRYSVRSVGRAIELLQEIEKDPTGANSTVTKLALSVGMSKGSVYSTLQTLLAYGLITDRGEGASRTYRLGLGLFRLGQSATKQSTVADVSTPVLSSLMRATGLTSRAALLDGDWALVVACVFAPGAVRLDLRLGEREWPHCSAVGKSLMSALSDPEARQIVSRLGMPRHTRRTITDIDQFIEELAITRERGYAVDDEEDADGIVCISAPVLDTLGRPYAALSITGLKADPALEDTHAVAAVVRSHADTLSALVRGRAQAVSAPDRIAMDA
ncbi:IclR family transcriptional regulator [Diaminobutyricibacter tongyongensis]|uniref:IclR family transcriptional regulator n=1 Tax=Leifsonia tongyongensis TaxID=1268043 RepID=A0A6L9XU93_9MICO|nr:IclR family transcriptional regulator [Diaminobutyricibacter tongyongensis]